MNVLTSFDAENISLPLQFTDYGMQSEMFQFAGPQVASTFKLPITMNNHVYGVSPESFTEYHLDEIFNVISLSYDRQNQPFISTMEGNGLPIFSSQWHPEKPEFEWNPDEGIDHFLVAVVGMQTMSNFFVQECRKSSHRFDSSDLQMNSLIYQYNATYTEAVDATYMQAYFIR